MTAVDRRGGARLWTPYASIEIHFSYVGAWPNINGVGQIKTTLGFHDESEKTNDIAILPIKLKLEISFVPLDVLGAHGITRSASLIRASCPGSCVADVRFHEVRCHREGPCCRSAA